MRVLIVDDEPLARARIRKLLSVESDVEQILECENGLEAAASITTWQPDLVFLDVQMPGLDGFGVVERIGPARMPVTVFVTAFDEFALKAFDAHALDYLLKPFGAERLQRALARAREQLALRQRSDLERKLTALLGGAVTPQSYTVRFPVRSGSRISLVEAASVDWIGAEGNYIALHAGRQVHLIRETMTDLDKGLDPKRFVRIHRSTIVRIDAIRAVESILRGEYIVILKDGTRLGSSSSYRDRLEAALLIPR